ncbi:hypothetical protein KC460_01005 [Candidatus Dependentiae bacterium]|nr:hypothetical protein [Candidatus Dependentiae bacterium]
MQSGEKHKQNNLFVYERYVDLTKVHHIGTSLQEEDIIKIQHIFMSCGVHHVKIKNITAGREIIAKFLNALNCYCEVGCLTMEKDQLFDNVWDMYYHLIGGGYIQCNQLVKREQFFVDEFYADFLWVEATDKLMLQSWFVMIQKALVDLHIDQYVPIIFLSYEDQ